MKKTNILKVSARHYHYVGTLADGSVRPEWKSALGLNQCDVAVTRILNGQRRGKRALITWGLNLPVEQADQDTVSLFAMVERGSCLERVIAIAI